MPTYTVTVRRGLAQFTDVEVDAASRKKAPARAFAVRAPHWTKAVALTCTVALAACAGGSKQSTIPSDGPTMSEVYRRHMEAAGVERHSVRDRLPLREPEDVSPAAYTRTALSEIDNRFARLPNPDLVMYVTPHLATGGHYPVPGYTTVFPMFETVEYAMPGEVASRRSTWVAPADTGEPKEAAKAKPSGNQQR